MNNRPVFGAENIKELYYGKFINMFDIEYAPGRHYLDATRHRKVEDLTAVKSDEEFKNMIADAVSCAVVLNIKGKEPVLCLTREYRFPTGQFLLSVPAGLLDSEDLAEPDPIYSATKRELMEETGLELLPTDDFIVVNPLIFSTPGLTDESNAFVKVVLNRDSVPGMNQDGAVGGECFDGFLLLNKEEALRILRQGKDDDGIFYSTYTWMALVCFVTDIW